MRDGESIRPAAECGGYCVDLRWRDLDHQGHVYHATVLTLLDEARTAWLDTKVNVTQPDSYVVVRIELDYRNPLLRTDGGVMAHFRPLRVGNTSITVIEKLCVAQTGAAVAESVTTIVMWDRESAAPRPISTSERKILVDEQNLAFSEGGQP
jgi:acyl-CoA thioester hydrolase